MPDYQPSAYRPNVSSPLDEFGNYALITGSGTETLDLDNRVRVAGLRVVGGTVTINGNDPIDTADFGGEIILNPKGNLRGPTIEIAGASAYLIEVLSSGTVP